MNKDIVNKGKLYMSKKTRIFLIIIVIIIAILIIFGIFTSYIDSARVRNNIEPKYTLKIVSNNGDKITYWGLGYKIIRYPSVSPNEPYKNKLAAKYGNWFMSFDLDRYKQMKENIDKEMERYLNFIAPNCSSENAGGFLTHKDLVYNNGFDKEKLLDIDEKSYCSVYVKYKCVEYGKWNWKTTIKCNNYEDKAYEHWAEKFPIKNNK